MTSAPRISKPRRTVRRLHLAGLVLLIASGCGEPRGAGTIEGRAVPAAVIRQRTDEQRTAAARVAPSESAPADKQILFGDLHVHTTFSVDAFVFSLPMLQGDGAHPPADACDFARYCSALDFWSINDHAEALSPAHWRETKESVRQCNARAGDTRNPDLVTFLGWEWTQVGMTAADHYGHKNVILRETAEERVPKRPISALNERTRGAFRNPVPLSTQIKFPIFDFPNRSEYFDFGRHIRDLGATPPCADGVNTRDLPEDCSESAETPETLFRKLDEGGYDSIVIPHGTTWGVYTPPDSSWDKQLNSRQHDPQRQTLFEVFSGHGNSEEYREWRPMTVDAKGQPVCPAPSTDYEPCCWRAGEIIRSRCGDIPADECEERVRAARLNYLGAGMSGHLTVLGTTVEDWKDCGQCRDCFNPSFNYRPLNSAQYTLAIGNFDDPKAPKHFRFGFIASSDNHSARPGTGYKEFERRRMAEATGARDAAWRDRIGLSMFEKQQSDESHEFNPRATTIPTFLQGDVERQASFFMTGGLVAVHAEGRDRDAIWSSLKRREVYGTSGERILLWFDLLNGPSGELAMGSEASLGEVPRFRVRAVGSFKQKPGCPNHSLKGLSRERLERLCRGECYNPDDERYRITRVEVVRIRPQQRKGEDVDDLVEDPWRRFECPDDPSGCVVEFDDPDLPHSGRPAVYYVRALQEPTLAVNAAQLRCEYDDTGQCVKSRPCYGDYRTSFDDDCLAPNEERAWSSPIYLSPSS